MISSGFNSRRRFFAFIFILILPLILPWVIELLYLGNLRSSYVQFSNFSGSYNVYHQVIESPKKSQILIFGNSGGLSAIDPIYLEPLFKNDLNEDVEVRNISVTGDSVALPYLILEDLIKKNKKPELFIYQLPGNESQFYHPSSRILFKLTEHYRLLLEGTIDLQTFAKFYAVKALDSMSALLHLILNWDVRLTKEFIQDSKTNNGAKFYKEVPLTESNYDVAPNDQYPDRSLLFKAAYKYTNDQLIWYKLLEKLAAENQVRLVYMLFPYKRKGYQENKFNIALNFDSVFKENIHLMGITRSQFESSLTKEQIKDFDGDPHHFGRDISILHSKWLYPQMLRHLKETRGKNEE